MDEGLPIAYGLLDKTCRCSPQTASRWARSDHIVAAPEQDIFHGLVISTPGHGLRFVEAADVATIHERGVDLRIDTAAAQSLPQPGGGAPVFDEDPGEMKGWHHWAHKATMRGDWKREG